MSRWWLLLVAAALFAAEPFEGTWRVDLGKIELPQKAQKIELANGMYTCSTCVPKISVKADGTDQRVADSPFYDTMNVKVVDAQTVESTTKKGGKITGTEKDTVSADGQRMTIEFTEYRENTKQPVTGKVVEARVEKGAPGGHAISGAWRDEKVETISSNGLTATYKSTTDGLNWSAPTGESYTAKFDGKDYPVKGDPGADSVSLKRIDANCLEQTWKRAGKVVNISRVTVAADGKSATVVADNKVQGTTIKYTLTKQ